MNDDKKNIKENMNKDLYRDFYWPRINVRTEIDIASAERTHFPFVTFQWACTAYI